MDVTLGSSTELIKGFAEFFVKDILKRLPSNRKLSILDIYKAIGIVANQAISGAQGADLGTLREHSLLRLGMSDERTLLQRAIQCGLLVYNDSRILFCHALLCEFFVAYQITTDTTLSNEQKVHEISGLPGRASVAQFASMLDSELILQFVKLQPSLVDKFKPEMLDVHVTQELHAQAKSLLNSKYPSDRQTGVRIFRTLQTGEAKQIAVDWYNNLNQNERSLFYQDAIDLFMVLEIPEAVGIVAQHHGFFASSDIALYDPDFVHSLEHLSDVFRNTLADYAFEGLLKAENGTQAEARFTTILSLLRDPRLVVQLEGKAQVDLLQLYEHRALIHINTEQAMKIYLKSRDYYYRDLDEIDPEKEGNDYKRSTLWYRLVPKQSDISLFPHDAILELIKQALRSKNWNDVSFGIEFASTLQNPDLMDPYADAIAQRRRKTLIVRAEMIRNIVVMSDVDTILELFDKVTSLEAKKLILRAAGNVHSERIEELLINSLDDEDLFDSACIGLKELRSIRSAPKIYTYLPRLNQLSLYYAIIALGRFQYEPALDYLIPMLEKKPLKYTDDDNKMNNEYDLINAIGEIGGQTAWNALAKRSKGQMLGRILTYLIDSQEEHAFGIVHDILESDTSTPSALYRRVYRLSCSNKYLKQRSNHFAVISSSNSENQPSSI
ncbi:MAG: hypothetical protein KAR40_16245 [Candidatus Sabulitectum sp.]|nr:hypothetical protein [Candidatus Sabulitectum sp.]